MNQNSVASCNPNGYQNGRLRLTVSPFVLYVTFMLTIYILPSLKVTVPYIVAGGIMLIFLPLIWNRCKWLTNDIILLIASTGLIFIQNLALGTYSPVESMNEAIRNFRFFIPVLISVYMIRECSVKRSKALLLYFIVLVSFVWYKTSMALAENQWIARILASSTASDTPEIRAYRLQNVGGFEFSYMIGILSICFSWIVFNTSKALVKIMAGVATLLGFAYIIQTMYTTLLLLTSVCVMIVALMSIDDKRVRLLIVVVSLLLLFALPQIMLYMSSLFGDSLLKTKFEQISHALTGGGTIALGSRPEKIKFALQNWLENPLFGGNIEGINSHSLIVGQLASNGLVGLALWLYVFYRYYKRLVFELKSISVDAQLTQIACLFVMMLSFFNPIGYAFEITIAAFLITPQFTRVFMTSEKGVGAGRMRRTCDSF